MTPSPVAKLKPQIDLRTLVERSYVIGRGGKIRCPFHDDEHPSCHIYPDGYKCFGCGAYGDAIAWLEQVEGYTNRAAIEHLRNLIGEVYRPRRVPRQRSKLISSFKPISNEDYKRYCDLLCQTQALPKALEGRGLNLDDAVQLGLAADGEDAVISVFGPQGHILALKKRFFIPRLEQRYVYLTAGQGSPAWCSPGLSKATTIVIVEGELNAAVSYLALREAGTEIGVMGVAGIYGRLHEDALQDKTVFIWSDDDAPGRLARKRWLARARRLSTKTKGLPGRTEDACEIAASQGRLYLASWLLEAMHKPSKKRSSPGRESLLWAA